MRFQNLDRNLAHLKHVSKEYEGVLPESFKMDSISFEVASELYSYDNITGLFRYKTRRARNVGKEVGDVAGYKRSDGYIIIGVLNTPILAHRLAFLLYEGKFPIGLIDHIDGNRSNNSWTNLRQASICENTANAAIRKDNTSGVKGVTKDKYSDRWIARIQRNGTRICIGYFNTIEEAAVALDHARNIAHKEFSNVG